MPASLRGRMLLAGVLIAVVFVIITVIALDRSFVATVDQQARDRLKVHVYTLLAAAEATDDSEEATGEPDRLVSILEKTRFNRQGEGLFGFVVAGDGAILWRSASALLIDVPPLPSLAQGSVRFGRVEGRDTSYYAMGLGTYWEAGETSFRHTFYVLESTATADATLHAFRSVLWEWLVIMTTGLVIALFLVIRWGLRPLKELGRKLMRLQSGDIQRIEGRFPDEIRQVVADLNALLAFEERQREKYRNSLADLAHSLKTPLSVMQNVVDPMEGVQRRILQEQLQQMNTLVQQQLRRAMTRGASLWGRGCEPVPALQRIMAALRKAWPDKPVDVQLDVRDQVLFPGEESVWYELAGNLLDNAFKYGAGHVVVRLSRFEEDERPWFRAVVEDDGPGIREDRREAVFARGTRLDTAVPGQGIGLAMVAELVDDLAGRVSVGQGSLGGACFILELPG